MPGWIACKKISTHMIAKQPPVLTQRQIAGQHYSELNRSNSHQVRCVPQSGSRPRARIAMSDQVKKVLNFRYFSVHRSNMFDDAEDDTSAPLTVEASMRFQGNSNESYLFHILAPIRPVISSATRDIAKAHVVSAFSSASPTKAVDPATIFSSEEEEDSDEDDDFFDGDSEQLSGGLWVNR